jgi:hypothetical protein
MAAVTLLVPQAFAVYLAVKYGRGDQFFGTGRLIPVTRLWRLDGQNGP